MNTEAIETAATKPGAEPKAKRKATASARQRPSCALDR